MDEQTEMNGQEVSGELTGDATGQEAAPPAEIGTVIDTTPTEVGMVATPFDPFERMLSGKPVFPVIGLQRGKILSVDIFANFADADAFARDRASSVPQIGFTASRASTFYKMPEPDRKAFD